MLIGKVVITSFMVTQDAATLYTETGETHILSKDHFNIKNILSDIASHIVSSTENKTRISINLDDYSIRKIVEQSKNTTFDSLENTLTIKKPDGQEIKAPTDKLKKHIVRASQSARSKEALNNFLKLMEKTKRKHGSQEILNFLEYNDMPLADNGFIIAFKALYIKENENGLRFTDKHTKKIPQDLGSLVYMDPDKVDDNRRLDCSTGYHVCSIDYLKNYFTVGENALTLTLVDPRDVISVPINEKQKMRTSRYFIAHEFNEKTSLEIIKAKSPTDIKSVCSTLNKVAAGIHSPHLSTIYEKMDGSLSIKFLKKDIKKKNPSMPPVSIPVNAEKSQMLDTALINRAIAARESSRAEKIEIAKLLRDNGAGTKYIAKLLKVSDSRLGKELKKSTKQDSVKLQKEVPIMGKDTKSNNVDKISKNAHIYKKAILLVKSGQSIRSAAKECGIPESTLRGAIGRTKLD